MKLLRESLSIVTTLCPYSRPFSARNRATIRISCGAGVGIEGDEHAALDSSASSIGAAIPMPSLRFTMPRAAAIDVVTMSLLLPATAFLSAAFLQGWG